MHFGVDQSIQCEETVRRSEPAWNCQDRLDWTALMLWMGPFLTSTIVDMKWLLTRYCTLGALADIQRSIPNSIPSENFVPHILTTAALLLRRIARPGPSATPRESTNAWELIRVDRSGSTALWKAVSDEWDKTGGQTRPSVKL
jgi:hypothetical protein